MRTQFSRTAAWLIALAMIAGIGGFQWWQACHASALVAASPAQVLAPMVEIVPEDRPDRHGLDDNAFAEERDGGARPMVPTRSLARRTSPLQHP